MNILINVSLWEWTHNYQIETGKCKIHIEMIPIGISNLCDATKMSLWNVKSHSQQREVIIIEYKFWYYEWEYRIVLFLYQGSRVNFCFICFTSIEHNLNSQRLGSIIMNVHCYEWSLEKGESFQWRRKTKQPVRLTLWVHYLTDFVYSSSIRVSGPLGLG